MAYSTFCSSRTIFGQLASENNQKNTRKNEPAGLMFNKICFYKFVLSILRSERYTLWYVLMT